MSETWWEVTVAFPEDDEAKAEAIWDAIANVACGGWEDIHGDHTCERDIVSSIKLAPLEEEE